MLPWGQVYHAKWLLVLIGNNTPCCWWVSRTKLTRWTSQEAVSITDCFLLVLGQEGHPCNYMMLHTGQSHATKADCILVFCACTWFMTWYTMWLFMCTGCLLVLLRAVYVSKKLCYVSWMTFDAFRIISLVLQFFSLYWPFEVDASVAPCVESETLYWLRLKQRQQV